LPVEQKTGSSDQSKTVVAEGDLIAAGKILAYQRKRPKPLFFPLKESVHF
jgi:hypothetical protein